MPLMLHSRRQVGVSQHGATHRLPARPPRRLYVIRQAASTQASESEAARDSASSTVVKEDANSSGCPFLQALEAPPKGDVSLLRRLQIFNRPAEYHRELLAGQPLVEGRFMVWPAIFTGTAELGRNVLAAELEGKTVVGYPAQVRSLIGEHSLLFCTGQRHKYLRALMQPAFASDALGELVPQLSVTVQETLEGWAARSAAHRGAGYPFTADHEARAFTFGVIGQIIFGSHVPRETITYMGSRFEEWRNGLGTYVHWDVPLTQFGRSMAARRQMLGYISKGVASARAKMSTGGSSAACIVDKLVVATDEEGNRLTDAEIADNIMLMLFAGFDTTSSTLQLMLYNLAKAPHYLDELRSEQEVLMAEHGRAVTARVVRDSALADAVFRETLRKDNLVVNLIRAAAQDLELGGHRVDAGTLLAVPLTYLTANDPRYSERREEFWPERMLRDDTKKQGEHMPFGAGNRYCLGAGLAAAEMNVFLIGLARSGYSIEADTSAPINPLPFPAPANGLPMRLVRSAPPLDT